MSKTLVKLKLKCFLYKNSYHWMTILKLFISVWMSEKYVSEREKWVNKTKTLNQQIIFFFKTKISFNSLKLELITTFILYYFYWNYDNQKKINVSCNIIFQIWTERIFDNLGTYYIMIFFRNKIILVKPRILNSKKKLLAI